MTGASLPDGADAVVMVEDSRDARRRQGRRAPPGGAAVAERLPQGRGRTPRRRRRAGGHPDRRSLDRTRWPRRASIRCRRSHRRGSASSRPATSSSTRTARRPAPAGSARATARCSRRRSARSRRRSRRSGPASPATRARASSGSSTSAAITTSSFSRAACRWATSTSSVPSFCADGLEVLVEKVAIKPGKPLLFGRIRRRDGGACHVFGLPGNPVSSFVTFELFVRPFLLRLLGHDDVEPDVVRATLDAALAIKPIPRTQHLPAVLSAGEDGRLRAKAPRVGTARPTSAASSTRTR